MSGFWGRRSKLGKVLIVAALVIIALGIAVALVPTEDEEVSPPATTETEAAETQPTATEELSEAVTGKVRGIFARDCLLCDRQLARFIRTSDVWCGWRGDTLLVHVRMRNRSVEHLTVNWHPSYTIARGGEHGAGLGSVQSDGFDGGESRELSAEQEPEGVAPGAKIGKCKPSFQIIESG